MKKNRKKSASLSNVTLSESSAPLFFKKPFTDPRFFADKWVPESWREEKLNERF